MRPNWPKLANLALKTCTLDGFQFIGVILASKGEPFDRTFQTRKEITKQ